MSPIENLYAPFQGRTQILRFHMLGLYYSVQPRLLLFTNVMFCPINHFSVFFTEILRFLDLCGNIKWHTKLELPLFYPLIK